MDIVGMKTRNQDNAKEDQRRRERGQTGDRRGEHAVADDHTRPEQREEEQQPLQHLVPLQQRPGPRHGQVAATAPGGGGGLVVRREVLAGAAARQEAGADVAADEGVEREGAALAAVVGAEDDEDVLEEGDEGERPEDEGEDAVDLLVARRVRDVVAGEGALEDVERRGGHVAVHHPEALVRQQQHRAPRLPALLLLRRRKKKKPANQPARASGRGNPRKNPRPRRPQQRTGTEPNNSRARSSKLSRRIQET